MIVLIDAGNTRIKAGWVDAATGEREASALALRHADIDLLPSWLGRLAGAPIAAIGVNVAGPAVARSLDAVFQRRHSFGVRWVGSQAHAAGVRNAYDVAAQLGADRWVSMIGLAQHADSDSAAILASFGTATTIDTLGPEAAGGQARPAGRLFHGGLIFPGPALMRSSLAAGTANLPEADGPAAAYPTHTHQAIASGIAAAQAGALLRQWREGLDEFGRPPLVFSTGGGWSAIEDEARRLLARAQADLGLPQQPIQWLSAPVLDGLARLALAPL
ncbi:type III pantothenate kinase [Pollutimonas bauzanensis]|uniref:Type III pantothenate kinase n=1 Tax=Pollutimonas bauzanensis TaxID=658167 RepID=A0A1M5T048_9BURK|nr:type III pantothenate kinase [Pollutimonas bauzanensis]SHH44106.1 type III pantothenate kinase [Pollutimonas bauzanensis]